MTRGSLTLYGARIACAATLAVTIPALASCGDDDEPPDPSVLDEIGAVLCEIQRSEGSVFDGSEVVVLTDC